MNGPGLLDDELREVRFDIFALNLGQLQPEVAAVVEHAFPELDGRELADLKGRSGDKSWTRRGRRTGSSGVFAMMLARAGIHSGFL
jgi:hypothetical protein